MNNGSNILKVLYRDGQGRIKFIKYQLLLRDENYKILRVIEKPKL